MEHLGYTSAALLIGGGLFGFRRGSRASLIGGTALAAALAGAATATKKSEHVGAAAAAAAAVGGLCFAVGAKRWSQSPKKAVPAFLVAVGAANALYYGFKAYEFRDNF